MHSTRMTFPSGTLALLLQSFFLGAVVNGQGSHCPLEAVSCGDCIQFHPDCVWCSQQELGGPRCGLEADLLTRGCSSEHLHPHPAFSNFSKDLPFGVKKPTIRPQEAVIHLRKGQETTINVEVVMGWNDFCIQRDGRDKPCMGCRLGTCQIPAMRFDVTSPEFVEVIVGHYCLDFSLSSEPGSCGRGGNSKQPLIAYDITFALVACPPPENALDSYTILIRPVGHRDKLRISFKPLCTCDCEKPERTIAGAGVCGGRGKEACGVCQCDQGYYGPQCACLESKRHLYLPDAHCLKPGDNLNDGYCSGRGDCACGVCRCHNKSPFSLQKWTGTHCECDDGNCPINNADGRMCGGSEKGICRCGTCNCRPGYVGRACQMHRPNDYHCVTADGDVCSGRGQCVNNACVCQSPYSGALCEECQGAECQCQAARACVLCRGFQSGLSPSQCASHCHNVLTYPVMAPSQPASFRVCTTHDPKDGCEVTFAFDPQNVNEAMRVYYVSLKKDC